MVGSAYLMRWSQSRKAVVHGQEVTFLDSGRDLGLVKSIRGARSLLVVRTEAFSLVPLADELGLAAQRGVRVVLRMTPESRQAAGGLVPAMQTAGISVEDDPQGIQGALVEVDGGRMVLYSPAPLVPTPSGKKTGYLLVVK